MQALKGRHDCRKWNKRTRQALKGRHDYLQLMCNHAGFYASFE